MRWLDYRRMRVSSLKLPSEVFARMKEPRVAALAASTDELGGEPMQAPTVNADTSPPTLVAGRDRMAATLLRKRKFVWVHVGIDWSPLELLKAEIHENLHRRHDDKAALTAQLVDKAEAALNGHLSVKSDDEAAPAHRPATPRGRARAMVAEASGQSVDAVRKADERAKSREEEAVRNGTQGDPASPAVHRAPRTPDAPPIETFGKPLPVRMAIGLPQMNAEFGRLDHLLRQAQEMGGHFEMWSHPATERIVRALHDAAVLVRSERPTHLCPACDGESQDCATCVGRGWVTKATFESAPKDKSPEVAKAKKLLGVRVVVVDEQGVEHEVSEADLAALNSDDERSEVNDADVPF